VGVAKAGDRLAPVGFFLKATNLILGYVFPPGHEAVTAPAGHNVLAELF